MHNIISLAAHRGHAPEPQGLEVISSVPSNPTGPSIVFVHGAFAGAWCWAEHFLDHFAKLGYPSHALSLRGHGASAGQDGLAKHSLSDYVSDLAMVVRAMDGPVVLVGHSMGGFVVQKYLERLGMGADPGVQIGGAVLMASVPPQGLVPPTMWMAWTQPALIQRLTMLLMGGPELANQFLVPDAVGQSLFASDLSRERVESLMARFRGESQRVVLDMTLLDPLWLWCVPRVPMLVLGAEHDAFVPPALVHMTGLTYGRPVEVVRGMGHAMMLEADWERAAEPIVGWLSGT
mgnify:CR=1 FL=1